MLRSNWLHLVISSSHFQHISDSLTLRRSSQVCTNQKHVLSKSCMWHMKGDFSLMCDPCLSLGSVGSKRWCLNSCVHIIPAALCALCLPAPHTDTTHTTKREWAPGPVCQSASAKVTPTKSWRSLDTGQEQSGGAGAENWQLKTTETVGCLRPRVTSAAPVKGHKWRWRERQAGQTHTSHNNLLTSPGVTLVL